MTLYARQAVRDVAGAGPVEAVVAGRLRERDPMLRDQGVEVLHDRGVIG